jgi:DNA-binding MarR family transcriptional regulator
VSSEEPWLDKPQLEAWIAMMSLLETFPQAVEAQLKQDSGINLFEYTLLAMLSERPDHTLVMSELADLAMGSLSRLSHAISRLEGRGLVERQAGVGGRRHNIVRLTPDGATAITAAAPGHVANVRRLLIAPLTDDEIAAFTSIGRKLVAAADPGSAQRLQELTPQIVAQNLDRC